VEEFERQLNDLKNSAFRSCFPKRYHLWFWFRNENVEIFQTLKLYPWKGSIWRLLCYVPSSSARTICRYVTKSE